MTDAVTPEQVQKSTGFAEPLPSGPHVNPGTFGSAVVTPRSTPSFTFMADDQRVTFYPDGRVVYEGTPDEAAKVFWKAVEASWPADWKRQGTP